MRTSYYEDVPLTSRASSAPRSLLTKHWMAKVALLTVPRTEIRQPLRVPSYREFLQLVLINGSPEMASFYVMVNTILFQSSNGVRTSRSVNDNPFSSIKCELHFIFTLPFILLQR